MALTINGKLIEKDDIYAILMKITGESKQNATVRLSVLTGTDFIVSKKSAKNSIEAREIAKNKLFKLSNVLNREKLGFCYLSNGAVLNLAKTVDMDIEMVGENDWNLYAQFEDGSEYKILNTKFKNNAETVFEEFQSAKSEYDYVNHSSSKYSNY